MTSTAAIAAMVLEKLREFERVAGLLAMPASERLGILNLSAATYATLRGGGTQAYQHVRPELERRLNYALPLMRRLASNSPVLRIPDVGERKAA